MQNMNHKLNWTEIWWTEHVRRKCVCDRYHRCDPNEISETFPFNVCPHVRIFAPFASTLYTDKQELCMFNCYNACTHVVLSCEFSVFFFYGHLLWTLHAAGQSCTFVTLLVHATINVGRHANLQNVVIRQFTLNLCSPLKSTHTLVNHCTTIFYYLLSFIKFKLKQNEK